MHFNTLRVMGYKHGIGGNTSFYLRFAEECDTLLPPDIARPFFSAEEAIIEATVHGYKCESEVRIINMSDVVSADKIVVF